MKIDLIYLQIEWFDVIILVCFYSLFGQSCGNKCDESTKIIKDQLKHYLITPNFSSSLFLAVGVVMSELRETLPVLY